jgi:hypothetical protein
VNGPQRVVGTLRCAICGTAASSIECIPPGENTAIFNAGWSRDSTYGNVWIYQRNGIETSNGSGSPIEPAEVELLRIALDGSQRAEALLAAHVHADDGFCRNCELIYCRKHWSVGGSGYGHCPRGHGASLDPLWSPE